MVLGLTVLAASTSSPYSAKRGSSDGELGSGPLATVVQDLLSIGIYFAIATVVVL